MPVAERSCNCQVGQQLPDKLTMGCAPIDEKILTESDRKRLDVLQFYGDYPITALMTLADLEFCKRAAEARLSTSHLSHSTATGQ
jgi:hypothetical protein